MIATLLAALAAPGAAILSAVVLPGCEDMGEFVPDEQPFNCTPVSFAADVAPLLANSCALAGCHLPPTNSGGLDLRVGESYANLLTVIDPLFQLPIVEPGDLEASILYYRLIGDTDYGLPMPPVPRPPLAADEIQRVLCWIEQGALEN